jgi:hypothetical protein
LELEKSEKGSQRRAAEALRIDGGARREERLTFGERELHPVAGAENGFEDCRAAKVLL